MGPEAQWRDALKQGRFLIQRARASGACFFPPRSAEPLSGDRDWEWIEASGAGTVHSVTVVHPRPPQAPYNVVLVDLAEGPRMMSRVEGGGPVRIGMSVQARIDSGGTEPIILFDPA